MKKNNQEITHVVAAVDIVILKIEENILKVLSVKIDTNPFKNHWALPGGMMLVNENIDDAVKRHLKNKTGIENIYYEQLYTFGDVDRDPRGRTVSISHIALMENKDIKIETSSSYLDIQWMDVKVLLKQKLAYDHAEILKKAIERLKSKLEYTNIAKYLLPKAFTLTQLQNVHEIVLDKKIDKRNFRKKILSLDIIKNTNKKISQGAHRPAELFEFKNKKVLY